VDKRFGDDEPLTAVLPGADGTTTTAAAAATAADLNADGAEEGGAAGEEGDEEAEAGSMQEMKDKVHIPTHMHSLVIAAAHTSVIIIGKSCGCTASSHAAPRPRPRE